MSRTSSSFLCAECGATSPRWAGRCPSCGAWNSISESAVVQATRKASSPMDVTALHEVSDHASGHRSSGVGELDRVLGGGLVPGSTTLLFGEPGIGKSTLALMALRAHAQRGESVLLVAAEESAEQVAQRARRLGEVPTGLNVVATADVAAAAATMTKQSPTLCVVDSVSAMVDDSLGSVAGSVTQVRNAAEVLCGIAKRTGVALILVGHVTKDGELSGPRALEHLVDTVIRVDGDRNGPLRLIRAVKHRFGPTGEVGLLEMAGDGLREVPDPSVTMRGPALDVPGVVTTVITDGSRSMVVEIQALVATGSGSPRRVAHAVSSQRLSLLLAVLEARCNVDVSGSDVFATTAGGLPAVEPAADLAIALAVASVAKGFSVPREWAALGEVGLAGELRSVGGLTRRVRELARLGVTTVLVPSSGDIDDVDGIVVRRCQSLSEALAVVTAG